MRRLMLITPVALLAIFLICYASFGSFSQASLVMMLAPFATVGGIAALWLRGMNLNVPAAIGFIAVVGIATIDGLVLVSAINKRLADGLSLTQARLEASATRLRPVLMTTGATVMGHFPLVLVSGAGAEARNSIGIVLVAGMLIGTTFTLFILPSVYLWLASTHETLPEHGSEPDTPTEGMAQTTA